MLFDSHTHFNNEDFTAEERSALLAEIDKAVSIGKMTGAVDIGFDPASSAMAAEHAYRWPWCFAADKSAVRDHIARPVSRAPSKYRDRFRPFLQCPDAGL